MLKRTTMTFAGLILFALGAGPAAVAQTGSAAPPPAPPSQDDPRAPRGSIVREEEVESEGLSPRLRILQALTYTNLTVDFDETPAELVFSYLRETLDITLMARYSDDAAGFGIDPETPITLKVEDTPALEVLEMVLEQCSDLEPCTWQLRRSFLEVGTRERLSSEAAQELRTYPVGDLLQEAPDFTDAPSLRLEDTLGYGVAVWPYGPWWLRDIRDPDRPGRPGRGAPPVNLPRRGRGGGGISPGGIIIPRGTGGGMGGGVTIGSGGGVRDPQAEQRNAESLMELITAVIAPEAWEQNGGTWATIAYRDGALFVRAPDYIHRELQGYPKVPPPESERTGD